ncbi:AAA family ATPase [Caldanaerobius polysaccharolyticus]|uniref:AAA family ATPase n=1 Tax=Caldanaerobius polysaccharolyticus TaxID=44256 RepID=UPI000478F03C|nr:MoxR family ATPase [Caldanaerobius polysaccharolyticus]
MGYRFNIEKLINNIQKVIVGKELTIRLMIIALLSGGHVLIEDMPGVGKTTLVKSLARSLNCSFRRIQFTPDLLPSDITGVSVFNQKTNEFEFKKGPVFSQIVLADEINRTSPKTQSSLLEVMEEGHVTVDGNTYPVEEPFMVLATQNPVEYEGTYPLPESQLDRFMMKISMGYPDHWEEKAIIKRFIEHEVLKELTPIMTKEELLEIKRSVRYVYIDDSIMTYIVNIVQRTRDNRYVYLGASPRASLMLARGAQANAIVNDRNYVIPDDVKMLAVPVLSHRLVIKPEYRLKGMSNEEFIKGILNEVNVPVVRDYA